MRLLLKSRSLGNADVRKWLLEAFDTFGVDSTRILTAPWEVQTLSHLATYGRIDIALDTSPYNGATTTCEALWMGVPVVTLSGATHASRMGASILGAAGLAELIASAEDDYIERAASLAGDLPRLDSMRGCLRGQLAGSVLMDHGGFARGFEAALWRVAGRG